MRRLLRGCVRVVIVALFAVQTLSAQGLNGSALGVRSGQGISIESRAVSSQPAAEARLAPAGAASAELPRNVQVTANEHHSAEWPYYALGGAALGGAAVGILIATNCGDDCMPALAVPVVAIGVLIGGIVGAIVGLIVDSTH